MDKTNYKTIMPCYLELGRAVLRTCISDYAYACKHIATINKQLDKVQDEIKNYPEPYPTFKLREKRNEKDIIDLTKQINLYRKRQTTYNKQIDFYTNEIREYKKIGNQLQADLSEIDRKTYIELLQKLIDKIDHYEHLLEDVYKDQESLNREINFTGRYNYKEFNKLFKKIEELNQDKKHYQSKLYDCEGMLADETYFEALLQGTVTIDYLKSYFNKIRLENNLPEGDW